MEKEKLIVKDAYENNLKHINVEIPLNAFTCVTGCSGCGKSSLVFDTLYAESQRGFLEGMTGNIYGQKLMNKPKVGLIENLRPALNISQNYYNVNPRSTIGTTTEISYYLRSLFAMLNSNSGRTVSEKIFSSNNANSCCPHCKGLGIEPIVSERLLIPNNDVTLRDGGITFFKGPAYGKEQATLQAMCDQYGIDVDKKVSELTKNELYQLLYSNDKIKCKINYKEGKRRKSHNIFLQGAAIIIMDKINRLDENSTSSVYSKYMEDVTCHVCGGSKLKGEVLEYRINGLNYYDVENMELTDLSLWLHDFDYSKVDTSKKELASQLIESMILKVDSLINLNIGYLNLSRSIPSLSGGERQRVRIATQLTCSLKGLIYILDEPCKGLHYRDVHKIVQSTQELVNKRNTVIAIEHNKQYITSADYVIELGPVGGPEGGYIINESTNPEPYNQCYPLRSNPKTDRFFEIRNIRFRNIRNQDVKIPIGGITCISGVSGSGKSTLSTVIASCFERKTSEYCSSCTGAESIKRMVRVDQAPIGKTPRSTIVSYLDIFTEIRNLFAKTEDAKARKLDASAFSMNTDGSGRCECCQGTGFQKIELKYLPDSYITCPECDGKRFKPSTLEVKYNGKNIHEVLEAPISDVVDFFSNNKKIYSALSSIMDLGLGYLKLGQMSMNLSGGEAQRIKLAKALGIASKGHNLYILDEPTSGLNMVDIERFEKTINTLRDNGETIIIVEHDVEFIAKEADYVIDFGLYGGNAGGKVVSAGTAQAVFNDCCSSLYQLDGHIY